jgi:protein TonB
MELKKNPKADVHQYRGMFFSVSLTITLALVITAFEWKSDGNGNSVNLANLDLVHDELLDIPPTEQTPPPPAQVIMPKVVEVPDDEEIAKEMEVLMDVEIKETSEVIPVRVIEEIAKEETDEVFLIVEDDPEFPGGTPAFQKFLKANIRYPYKARTMHVEGKVYVQAVVGKDGKLTDVQVLKGIGSGCDEEALRVINMSPVWKPGRQRGHAVKTRIVIPIVFTFG